MLTLEQIRDYLSSGKVNIEDVARTTGLSRMTIVRLKRGDGDASYRTVKSVSDYLEGEDDE